MTIDQIKDQLHEIIRLGELATAGPWEWDADFASVYTSTCVAECHHMKAGADAHLIAASRNITPIAAKGLLLAIDGLGEIASSDGDPHCDESAEYWAKERSSEAAKKTLETIRQIFTPPMK